MFTQRKHLVEGHLMVPLCVKADHMLVHKDLNGWVYQWVLSNMMQLLHILQAT